MTFNTQINIFPIIMLFILYLNLRGLRKSMISNVQNRVFGTALLLTMTIMVVDMVEAVLEGRYGLTIKTLLWILNSTYFVLTGAISFIWFLYVYFVTTGEKKIKLDKLLIYIIPFAVLSFMAVSAPFNKWLFYIDTSNEYNRGAMFFMQGLIGFGYIGAATLNSLWNCRKELLLDKKKEDLFLSQFMILPLIGGTIQLIQFGTITLWPCTALSLLLIYVNLKNKEVAIDSLTKLYNRSELERHLEMRCESIKERTLYMLLLDIDSFKNINDKYGHVQGDRALEQAAELLKTVFYGADCFVARYGGDEFAVILNVRKETTVKKYIEELNELLRKYNERNLNEYDLSFSIGYTSFKSGKKQTPDEILETADRYMYMEKKQKKGNINKIEGYI